MEHIISVIFHKNIELIMSAEKAIYYFRRQEYESALQHVIDTIDQITVVVEKLIEKSSYFSESLCSEICEILSAMLNAKKNKDFVLLADYMESRLIPTFLQVQSQIHTKEENMYYSLERYQSNIRNVYGLMSKSCNHVKQLDELRDGLSKPLGTKDLIEAGYRIEMTNGGVMTAAVANQGTSFYIHSNHQPMLEAFLLAEQWMEETKNHYFVYGFGLGYHVHELCQLNDKQASVTVYESDLQMIKLACAFTSCTWLKEYPNLSIIYDPDLKLFCSRLKETDDNVKCVIHYPSFQNIKEQKAREDLAVYLPYRSVLENC